MGVGHLSTGTGWHSTLFNVLGNQNIGCGGLEYVASVSLSLHTLDGIGIGLLWGMVVGIASDRTIFLSTVKGG